MKYVAVTTALLGGLCVFLIPQAYAQDSHSGAHTMLTPSELQWKDAAGLPPGTKITVIEGPMSEAVPAGLSSPRVPRSRLTGIPRLNMSR